MNDVTPEERALAIAEMKAEVAELRAVVSRVRELCSRQQLASKIELATDITHTLDGHEGGNWTSLKETA